MPQIETISFKEYAAQCLGSRLILTDFECGQQYNLTAEQKALINILAWIRRKRKGLKFCQINCIYPGPRGRIEKKHWCPRDQECCDNSYVDGIPYQRSFDPWIIYKHCLSTPHLEYLVTHRLSYIISIFSNHLPILPSMIDMISKNEIPLHLNDQYPLIKEFVQDVCTGKFQLEYKTI